MLPSNNHLTISRHLALRHCLAKNEGRNHLEKVYSNLTTNEVDTFDSSRLLGRSDVRVLISKRPVNNGKL